MTKFYSEQSLRMEIFSPFIAWKFRVYYFASAVVVVSLLSSYLAALHISKYIPSNPRAAANKSCPALAAYLVK